jgi:hypothetical protein
MSKMSKNVFDILDKNEIRNTLYEKGKRKLTKLRLKTDKCIEFEQYEPKTAIFKNANYNIKSRTIDAKDISVKNLRYKKGLEAIEADGK